jgi:hypothetical protein
MPAAIHKNYQLVHRPPRLIQVKTPEIILISGPSKKKKEREREIKHFMQQRPQIPNIVWKILWRIVN